MAREVELDNMAVPAAEWTPLHLQQSSPHHDERRFAGSERPALKPTSAYLSSEIQLVAVSFACADDDDGSTKLLPRGEQEKGSQNRYVGVGE